MPAPARTTTDAVVSAAHELIERDGLDALTMQRGAAAGGVKGPALYKRVDGREALVALVAEGVAAGSAGAAPASASSLTSPRAAAPPSATSATRASRPSTRM